MENARFIGREREIALLADALRAAGAGRGGLVLIAGEPGIGKTRTVEEFVRSAEIGPARVLWGRCPEHAGAPAFWPWVQVIRRYLEKRAADEVRAELGAAAGVVVRLVPQLRELLPELDASAPVDPEQSRFQLFEGIIGFLRRAALREPLVVVLDDLQWADEGSARLLAFAAHELRTSRVLLVGMHRSLGRRGDARLPAELGRIGRRVALHGLDRAEAGRFVERLAGFTPSAELLDELVAITGGNPFFLDGLARLLPLEEARENGGVPAAHVELPAGVRDAIRTRLELLAPEDRELLEIAAVIGDEFDALPLARVTGLAADVLLERLAAATQAGFLDEREPAGAFRFGHALIRETLYADLGAFARAQLHRRVGEALEALHEGAQDAVAAELGFHFYHSAPLGDWEKAIRYTVQAGESAVASFAWEDGVAHFERALAVLHLQPPDEARRLDLRLSLGHAAWRAGDAAKAHESFAAAARSARATGSAVGLARAALGLGAMRVENNSMDPALVALLEEALERLDPQPSPLRAALLGRLATALYFSNEVERRERLSEESLAMARRLGSRSALVAALLTRHLMLWGPGDVHERLALVDEAITLARRIGHRSLALEAQAWRIHDLLELGSVHAAELELESFERGAEEGRFPAHRRAARTIRATLAALRGRFAESARLAEEARSMAHAGGEASIEQISPVQSFVVARWCGRLAELEAPFTEMLRKYAAAPGWRCGLAVIHLEAGDPERARATFEAAAADFTDVAPDGNSIHALAVLAEVAASLGDVRRAERLYERLAPFAERAVVIAQPPAGCMGSVARFLGILATTLGRHDAAVAHLETALAANQRMAASPYVALTQVDLARALEARGRREDAARAEQLLASARSTADALGMVRLRERIDAGRSTAADDRAAAPAPRPVREPFALLRAEGGYWTLAHAEEELRLKDMKGLRYLAVLLRHPDREFHVLDLAAGTAGTGPAEGGGAAALDETARAAYKARLDELREELEEARSFNDQARAERAERALEAFAEEVANELGGARRSRSEAERARVNVTRAVACVIRKVAASSPTLGHYLGTTIRTGLFCSYNPDPRLPIAWEVAAAMER